MGAEQRSRCRQEKQEKKEETAGNATGTGVPPPPPPFFGRGRGIFRGCGRGGMEGMGGMGMGGMGAGRGGMGGRGGQWNWQWPGAAGAWASPTTEAGLPTCSRPRTGTSARCSTSSSRSRSRQWNVPGIPLGCLAVVLSAGNQSLYIFGSQHWEGTNPIYGQCLKHKRSKLYLHWYLCRDIYIYVFSQIAI